MVQERAVSLCVCESVYRRVLSVFECSSCYAVAICFTISESLAMCSSRGE